ETEVIVQSSDRNFRPVDVEIGPDGAIWFVDWANVIVGHMQHHIRDPNRDDKHGRVYRITYEGRPLSQEPDMTKLTIEELLEQLKRHNDRTRYRAKIELSSRPSKDVVAATKKWLAGLDKDHHDYEHHRLEALWVHQYHNTVDAELLKQVLASKDHRARAAATKVLCYWRDRVDEPLKLLQQQVNDQHPLVRLEAVRALSFFRTPEAGEIATEVLIYPMDKYLEYTLNETNKQLSKFNK
ncbi:MAG: HEAT repeat domain-containing protein, partial [Pirellulales bacterium]